MLGHAQEARGYQHPFRRAGRAAMQLQRLARPGRASLEAEADSLTASLLGRMDVRVWGPRKGEEGACDLEHRELTSCVASLAHGREGLLRVSPEFRLGEVACRMANPPLEPWRADRIRLGAAMLLGSISLGELGSFGVGVVRVHVPRAVRMSPSRGVLFSTSDDPMVRSTALAVTAQGTPPVTALKVARQLTLDGDAAREIALVLLTDGMPVADAVAAARKLAS